MRNDFSKQFLPILNKAYEVAERFSSPVIRPEHFVLSALSNSDGYAFKILNQLHVPIDKMVAELTESAARHSRGSQNESAFYSRRTYTAGPDA